jgi:hypothetical protein
MKSRPQQRVSALRDLPARVMTGGPARSGRWEGGARRASGRPRTRHNGPDRSDFWIGVGRPFPKHRASP